MFKLPPLFLVHWGGRAWGDWRVAGRAPGASQRSQGVYYFARGAQAREVGLPLLGCVARNQLGRGLSRPIESALIPLLRLFRLLLSFISRGRSGGLSGLRPPVTGPGIVCRHGRVRRGTGGLPNWPLRTAVAPRCGGACRPVPE